MDRICNLYVCSVAFLLGLLFLSGCSQVENSDKQTMGAGIGAVACGTLGAVLTKGSNKLTRSLAAAGGALGCGFLGSQIGSYLDAQDKQKMEDAAQAALATGEPQGWTSPGNKTSGTATIVPAAGNAQADAGANCRTIRNSITLADGTEKQEDVTACEGPDGEWEVQEG